MLISRLQYERFSTFFFFCKTHPARPLTPSSTSPIMFQLCSFELISKWMLLSRLRLWLLVFFLFFLASCFSLLCFLPPPLSVSVCVSVSGFSSVSPAHLAHLLTFFQSSHEHRCTNPGCTSTRTPDCSICYSARKHNRSLLPLSELPFSLVFLLLPQVIAASSCASDPFCSTHLNHLPITFRALFHPLCLFSLLIVITPKCLIENEDPLVD